MNQKQPHKIQPRLNRQSVFAILLIFGCVIHLQCQHEPDLPLYTPFDNNLQQALTRLDTQEIQRHMSYLASDALGGRGTGQPGGELAAIYIANELARMGIQPFGDTPARADDDAFGYLQQIPMHGSYPLPSSQLTLHTSEAKHRLALQQDYLLYTSGAQTFIPKPVPLVFVGYGIIAPEFDYNDYQSVDVANKVVVYLNGEPPSTDPGYFDGEAETMYAHPDNKRRMAIAQGARGSILIPNPRTDQISWQHWVHDFSFEMISLAYSPASHLSLVINHNTAKMLFSGTVYDLNDIFRMDRDQTITSFELKSGLSFKGEFNEREFLAANVIGLLEGADSVLKDEYIILSAHYDHFGIGPAVAGDSIYNGAFDNAAGVAGVLEIARVLSQMEAPPQRSIIFLFVTGEEAGVLGSIYYTEHPRVPLHRTMANINVDGLAMFDEFNDIIGVGAEMSTLEDHLKWVAAELNLTVSKIPPQFALSEAFVMSDQIAFAKAGIPSMLVSEGLHYKNTTYEAGLQRMIDWGRDIYHSPFDDLKQEINLAAARQHCQLLLALTCSLANTAQAPEWRPGVPFLITRLQTIAEKR